MNGLGIEVENGSPDRPVADRPESIAAAGRMLAEAFRHRAKLIAFGEGRAATDARHVAVEFLHPVIMGKRALPAITISDALAPLSHALMLVACPGDVLLGFACGGRVDRARKVFDYARELGLRSIVVTDEGGASAFAGDGVDHALVAHSSSRSVAESWVTIYHLLWEVTHVFLEDNGTRAKSGFQALYPSLYGGGGDPHALVRAVESSSREKLLEIAGLRERTLSALEPQIQRCARGIAAACARGGRIFTFGNGGSSCDADAIAQLFLSPSRGPSRPAFCLTNDVATVTALSNDVGFEVVFARQLAALAAPGDVAMASRRAARHPTSFEPSARRQIRGS